MAEEVNLALDLARFARRSGPEVLARVCVARARGFTKDGAAPTVSRDCTALAEFEREIARLKGELDAALDAARAHFGAAVPAAEPEAPPPEPASAAGPVRLPSDLVVADVMTRDVTTVGPNDRLSVADALMQQGGFRHLVVVDEDGRAQGVISQRDLFHSALAWSLGLGVAGREKALESYPVKQVMSTQLVTTDSATPLSAAAQLLIDRGVSCLPVVDGDVLVGILTDGDFLALLAAG